MNRQSPRFFVLLLLSLLSPSLLAADLTFRSTDGAVNVVLDGVIERGDSGKFIQLVEDSPREFMQAANIQLRSPGGSLDEALKLAQLIEKSGLIATVESGDTCASACFLLLVSAQFRWVDDDAKVLVHRPYPAAARADLDGFSKDQASQQEAIGAMRKFLQDRSIGTEIIDQMMTHPSTSAHRLSTREFYSHVRSLSPTLEELTIKRCGLSNQNIFTASRTFAGDPATDDLSCIRHFVISLKFDFTELVVGKERFERVFRTL